MESGAGPDMATQNTRDYGLGAAGHTSSMLQNFHSNPSSAAHHATPSTLYAGPSPSLYLQNYTAALNGNAGVPGANGALTRGYGGGAATGNSIQFKSRFGNMTPQ